MSNNISAIYKLFNRDQLASIWVVIGKAVRAGQNSDGRQL